MRPFLEKGEKAATIMLYIKHERFLEAMVCDATINICD